MNYLLKMSLFLIICSLIVGCTTNQCVIYVLFDISGSTAKKEIRQRYYNDFLKILDEINGGEILICDLITENTMATSSQPVNESFPIYNPFIMNKENFKRKLNKQKEKVKAQVDSLIFSSSTPMTDLLNAFQAADKILNGELYKDDTCKILVIFSDMIEETKSYNFKKEKLTSKRIEQIINELKKENKLPNLKGVKVWVAGAGVEIGGGLPPEKIYEIENFWMRYFKECGADLTKDRYSTTLINFRLHKED
jgi:hypothetical protein